jgi:hypothetical protein
MVVERPVTLRCRCCGRFSRERWCLRCDQITALELEASRHVAAIEHEPIEPPPDLSFGDRSWWETGNHGANEMQTKQSSPMCGSDSY